jgi:hypothetical protein
MEATNRATETKPFQIVRRSDKRRFGRMVHFKNLPVLLVNLAWDNPAREDDMVFRKELKW